MHVLTTKAPTPRDCEANVGRSPRSCSGIWHFFLHMTRSSCTFPSTSALQAVDDGVKRIRSEADSIPAAPSPALPLSASARSIVNHVKLSTCLIDSVFEGVLVTIARHLISTSGEWFCILLARAYGCYALCLKMRKHPAGRWLPRERLSLFWRKHVVGATPRCSVCFRIAVFFCLDLLCFTGQGAFQNA